PVDVLQEVLHATVEHQAAPHECGAFVLDEESHRHDAHETLTDLALIRHDHVAVTLHDSKRTFHAEHARHRIAPDVGVEHSNLQAPGCERRGQVHRHRRLPDATLARRD